MRSGGGFGNTVELEDGRLVLLYDWLTSRGARMVPRDFPYLKSQGPDQTEVLTGAAATCDGPFLGSSGYVPLGMHRAAGAV